MNRKWMYMSAIALLLGTSAQAQRVTAGDSGLTTPGGGKTTIDLAGFPVQEIFGAGVDGNTKVSLRGESLGDGALDGIDTIVRRPADVNVSSGQGTGALEIVALRMVGEKPVSIGGKSYALRVFLSEFRRDVKAGSVTFKMANADGGTFSSVFYVRPKLVFSNEGNDTVIDCGAVDCGEDLKMTATNASFVLGGVSGGLDPKARGIKSLPAGVAVDGDGDGVAELTTRAAGNLFIGLIPSRPTFPLDPVDKNEQSGSHTVVVSIPSSSPQALGTYVPSKSNQ